MSHSGPNALQRLLEVLPSSHPNPLGLTPETWQRIFPLLPIVKVESPEPASEETPPLDAAIAPIGSTRAPTRMVHRTFGFLDLASFTSTIARMDAEETTALLSLFRTLVREVAAARGCRIANWLGDGVLIVGVETAPVVATIMELTVRLTQAEIPVCSGVTAGEVLLFEGDDHIGTPVNLAARLSDLARPGQVLAHDSVLAHLPPWVSPKEQVPVKVKGLGKMKVTPLTVVE